MHMLNERVEYANVERIECYAAHEAAKAGKLAFEKENQDGMSMGFGRLPYDTTRSSERLEESNSNHLEWSEMRDFVNDTFLDMIEEDKDE